VLTFLFRPIELAIVEARAATTIAFKPLSLAFYVASSPRDGRFAGTLQWAVQGSNLRPWD
jgi:hypothetical protein